MAENHRETGARKLKPLAPTEKDEEFSQDAAENRKPKNGMGLTRAADENDHETRQSDAVQTPKATRPNRG